MGNWEEEEGIECRLGVQEAMTFTELSARRGPDCIRRVPSGADGSIRASDPTMRLNAGRWKTFPWKGAFGGRSLFRQSGWKLTHSFPPSCMLFGSFSSLFRRALPLYLEMQIEKDTAELVSDDDTGIAQGMRIKFPKFLQQCEAEITLNR